MWYYYYFYLVNSLSSPDIIISLHSTFYFHLTLLYLLTPLFIFNWRYCFYCLHFLSSPDIITYYFYWLHFLFLPDIITPIYSIFYFHLMLFLLLTPLFIFGRNWSLRLCGSPVGGRPRRSHPVPFCGTNSLSPFLVLHVWRADAFPYSHDTDWGSCWPASLHEKWFPGWSVASSCSRPRWWKL